ncbi:MAG: hypothetical protein V1775_06485 [Bacteroidota bacterium]
MKLLKGFPVFLLITLLIASCDPNGGSYEKYTGYVNIVETIIPDSAFSGEEIPVHIVANAPNGCWSDLTITVGKSVLADTLYGIYATGNYESYNGLCTEILIVKDTTYLFKPDTAGTYVFVSYSASLVPCYDTISVIEPLSVE